MASLKLYHRRPHGGSFTDKGAEEGDGRPRRGWPPSPPGGDFPAGVQLQRTPVAGRRDPLNGADLDAGRRNQDGRRFVPPGERPSTESQQERDVSDPACTLCHAAPEPTGGVAHAPCQCRRCAEARVLCAWEYVGESART